MSITALTILTFTQTQNIFYHEYNMWRLWAKALGEKAFDSKKDADRVAVIRTIIVGVNFITCFFIMTNIVHNW